MKTLRLIIFVLFLVMSATTNATANARPAVMSRSRRDTLEFIKSNESVSRYMLDVYNTLSNEPTPLRTETNTIRSLSNTVEVPGCDMFNFSLSGVYQSELAQISDLFLYMVRQRPSNDRLMIEIRKCTEEENADDFITSVEIVPQRDSDWLQFHLTSYLRELVPAGATHAAFRVIIKSGVSGQILDCKDSPITFAYSRDTEKDKAPYLTLHTYDNRIHAVDYGSILRNLDATDSMPSTGNTDANQQRRRRKREVPVNEDSPTIACQLNDFIVSSNLIPLPPIPSLEGATIVLPEVVNLGICGGGCSGVAPKHEELRHSVLAHHFLSKQGFRHEGRTVEKCCAPVEYKMESFIFSYEGSKNIIIINMLNMQIAKCDCLDVIDFTSSQT